MRLTIDLDKRGLHILDLYMKRILSMIEDEVDLIEIRISSSGKGYHLIFWGNFDKETVRKVREKFDDKKRYYYDYVSTWDKPKQVLFTAKRKWKNGMWIEKRVREIFSGSVNDYLDWIKREL